MSLHEKLNAGLKPVLEEYGKNMVTAVFDSLILGFSAVPDRTWTTAEVIAFLRRAQNATLTQKTAHNEHVKRTQVLSENTLSLQSLKNDTDFAVVQKDTGSPTRVMLPIGELRREVAVKDGKGDASVNPITVEAPNGELWVIRTNYGHMVFRHDGEKWFRYEDEVIHVKLSSPNTESHTFGPSPLQGRAAVVNGLPTPPLEKPCGISPVHTSCVGAWKDDETTFHHLGCREQRPGENMVMVHCGLGTKCATCKNEFG